MRFGFVLSEIGQGLRRNVSMVVSIILVTFCLFYHPCSNPLAKLHCTTHILLQKQIDTMRRYSISKC